MKEQLIDTKIEILESLDHHSISGTTVLANISRSYINDRIPPFESQYSEACTSAFIRRLDDKYKLIDLRVNDEKEITVLIGRWLSEESDRDFIINAYMTGDICETLLRSIIGSTLIANPGVPITNTASIYNTISNNPVFAEASDNVRLFTTLLITKWLDLFELRADATVQTMVKKMPNNISLNEEDLKVQYSRAYVADSIKNQIDKLKKNMPIGKLGKSRINLSGYVQYLQLLFNDIVRELTNFSFSYYSFDDILYLLGLYLTHKGEIVHQLLGPLERIAHIVTLSKNATLQRIAINSYKANHIVATPPLSINTELERFIRLMDIMPDYETIHDPKKLILMSNLEGDANDSKYKGSLLFETPVKYSFDVDSYKYNLSSIGFTDVRQDEGFISTIIPSMSGEIYDQIDKQFKLALINMAKQRRKDSNEKLFSLIGLNVDYNCLIDASLMSANHGFSVCNIDDIKNTQTDWRVVVDNGGEKQVVYPIYVVNELLQLTRLTAREASDQLVTIRTTSPLLALLAAKHLVVNFDDRPSFFREAYKSTKLSNRKSVLLSNEALVEFISIRDKHIFYPEVGDGLIPKSVTLNLDELLTGINKYLFFRCQEGWSQLVATINSTSDLINSKTYPASRLLRSQWRGALVRSLANWALTNVTIDQVKRRASYLIYDATAKEDLTLATEMQLNSISDAVIYIYTVIGLLNLNSLAAGGNSINEATVDLLLNAESINEFRMFIVH